MSKQTVLSTFRVKPVSGDIGIEVEVEGEDLPDGCGLWAATNDSSLRNGIEYVLRKPIAFSEVSGALSDLEDSFVANNSKLTSSVREAVHIHINVQNYTIVELFNFITLYLIFEEVLTAYCGPRREGNLFCLRSRDAEGFLHFVVRVLESGDLKGFNNDDIRSSSINLKALATYGSLEFRAMGTPEQDYIARDVLCWIELLVSIKDSAKMFEYPTDVVAGFSGTGYEDFLRKIFGPFADRLFLNNGWEAQMKNGMRNAQDVAYSVDWSVYNKEVPINPFTLSIGG